MLIRPKLFLTFLGLCLVPLILLALMNYWNSARVAERAVQREQASKSSESHKSLSEIFNDNSATVAANAEEELVDARRVGRIGLLAAVLLAMPSAWFLTRYWQRKARGIEPGFKKSQKGRKQS